MRNLIMTICAIIMLIAAPKLNGQNTKVSLSTKIEKLSPQDFLAQAEAFEADILGDDYVVVISFEKNPSKALRASLKKEGIQLLNYHSKNAYLAKVPTNIQAAELRKSGIKNIRKYLVTEKLSPEITGGQFPEWAVKSPGTIDIAIMLTDATERNRRNFIHQFSITNLQPSLRGGEIIIGRIAQDDLQRLTTSPMVAHVDALEPPAEQLNHDNQTTQKVNVLQASFLGARNLTGEGICVGVGDGGELGAHIDFEGRVTNYATGTYSSFGAHGDHVAGIIGGAGNLNPRHEGMAPKTDLLIQKTTSIISNAQTYYDDHQMVMTNNSYGVGYNCETNGTYNYSSNNLDWQSREMPELLHVYAAGNSGFSICGSYPDGYKSVLRYYQSAKNVLTVGNAKADRTLYPGSSKGPVSDGRLKPEICGVGTDVYSTGRNYDYFSGTGTSMASPSVVGTLTLLNERYRQLNDGDAPKGALIKAIACNTADDEGRVGPDYAYGFGLINGRRAVECIENQRYQTDAISEGETKTFTIQVPAESGQLKVMLYWHDVEADPYPNKALINDLDVTLTSPSGNSYLPWVLNPDSTNVTDLATRKVDTLNNIEQITLDNPTAGTYTITVNGTNIPTGPQEFFITYDFVNTNVVLTYPYGTESLEPNSTASINWDADANNTTDFNLEYSTDGGNNWNSIASGVDASVRHYAWSVPNVNTENAFVRITKMGTSKTDENNLPFSILKRPTNLVSTTVCEGHLELTWDAVPTVQRYEIYKLSGREMVAVDTVTENNYTTENLTVGEEYWYAVKGLGENGGQTERSVATRLLPDASGACPWGFDVSLKGVQVKTVGREGTSIALTNNELVTLSLKNLGANEIDTFEIQYQINNGTTVAEMYYENLPSGDTLAKTFGTTANFAAAGHYQINAFVNIAEDVNPANNQTVGEFEAVQLENMPIILPYEENFENIGVTTFNEKTIGLAGIEAWDFAPDTEGELDFVNEGTNRCISGSNFSNATTDEGITLTLNMMNYVNVTDVKMNFDYKYNWPDVIGEGDTIYVRGSDTDPWLAMTTLSPNDVWTNTDEINISSLLTENSQAFTSSFQVHFSQGKNTGYALDNVALHALTALPVELTTFTVTKVGNDAVLNWQTASEQDNHRFEIEMAKAPLPLTNDNFKRIGTVLGSGTTTTNHQYTFSDLLPFKSGYRYYRLKQINLDETFAYSAVRAVDFGEPTEVVVFPNPFISEINVQNLPKDFHATTIQIFEASGRLVLENPLGEHTENLNLQLDESLPSGFYVMRIISDRKTLTFPVHKNEK